MVRILSANRLLISWGLVVLCVASFVATEIHYQPNTTPYFVLVFAGYLLVAVCSLGRLYSTAFIGGYKTSKLITYGPFSVVRNPLYVFSFIGAVGIGLMSMHVALLIVIPAGAAVLFTIAVMDEERVLIEKFGQEYLSYMKSVPRFIPSLKQYRAPEVVSMNPATLKSGLIDALYWFLALPGFVILHKLGY